MVMVSVIQIYGKLLSFSLCLSSFNSRRECMYAIGLALEILATTPNDK